MSYRRIAVIGPAGAGKTSLSLRLAQRLQIPAIHLDREFWRAGFQKPCPIAWSEKVSDFASRDSWIIDGSYLDTIDCRVARADALIMLDIPRSAYMFGLLLRTFRNIGRVRVDLGLPERVRLSNFWNAFTYMKRNEGRFEKALLQAKLQGAKVVKLSSRREIAACLEELCPNLRSTALASRDRDPRAQWINREGWAAS